MKVDFSVFIVFLHFNIISQSKVLFYIPHHFLLVRTLFQAGLVRLYCNSSGITVINPLCKLKLQRGGESLVDFGFEIIKEIKGAKVGKMHQNYC
jgi:hypothetical protein